MIGKYGVLAQLVERQVRNLEVRGSTPLCSTLFFFLNGVLLNTNQDGRQSCPILPLTGPRFPPPLTFNITKSHHRIIAKI